MTTPNLIATTLLKPEFPEFVDSSILSSYKSCGMKYYWNYLRHLARVEKSVHLVAGGAFAHGLEHARKAFHVNGHSEDDSTAIGAMECLKFYGDFECPENSNKTAERMALGVDSYFQEYGYADDAIQPFFDKDGTPGIEFSFAISLPINHPVTGNPILYVGRYDLLGMYQNALYCVDEKTTTQLGASWLKQWDLRSQFTGYCWAAKQHGYPVVGAIVRGMSILKKNYGHAEVITFRSEHLIDRWYAQLLRSVHKMIEDWEMGYWDYDFSDACNAYGGCQYKELCDKKDPERWVASGFVVSPWNPMATP